MKTPAAVAFEVKEPLQVVELDFDGPRAFEVVVEIKTTGIALTDGDAHYTFDCIGNIKEISEVLAARQRVDATESVGRHPLLREDGLR